MLKVTNFKVRRKGKSYEARCTYYGKAISISAKTLTELKARLRAYVRNFNEQNKPTFPQTALPKPIEEKPTELASLPVPAEQPKPVLFNAYALNYLNTMKKDDVGEGWYKRQLSKLRLHINPFIGEKSLTDVTVYDCKAIIGKVRADKKFRTAEEVHCMLRQVFEFAVADGLIPKSPMLRIKMKKADREIGRCLSLFEELTLLKAAQGTRYEQAVILMLYAGLRPCECESAVIGEKFIVARNAKQKDGRIVYKKVPITPMMRRYLPLFQGGVIKIKTFSLDNWTGKFSWDIRPYYCRHTFNTRLAKFKLNIEYRELAMGHKSSSVNSSTYTHEEGFENEFFEEFQKVNYVEELNFSQFGPQILTPKKPKKPRK